MKTKSSRRTFLQAGLILPAAGLVIPQLSLEAAFQQPKFAAALRLPGHRQIWEIRD